jgi:hypothetical protein
MSEAGAAGDRQALREIFESLEFVDTPESVC